MFCIVTQAEECLRDTKGQFVSTKTIPETSPILSTTQSGLSQYFPPAVLVGSHAINVALPVMKTAYPYTAMVLIVVNKVPV